MAKKSFEGLGPENASERYEAVLLGLKSLKDELSKLEEQYSETIRELKKDLVAMKKGKEGLSESLATAINAAQRASRGDKVRQHQAGNALAEQSQGSLDAVNQILELQRKQRRAQEINKLESFLNLYEELESKIEEARGYWNQESNKQQVLEAVAEEERVYRKKIDEYKAFLEIYNI